MDSFMLRKGDRLPVLSATLLNSSGSAINLSGGSVEFHMRLVDGSTLKVNAAATIVSATAGTVSYSWGATDTNSTGLYFGEFEVTLAGLERTVPTPDFIMIRICEALG